MIETHAITETIDTETMTLIAPAEEIARGIEEDLEIGTLERNTDAGVATEIQRDTGMTLVIEPEDDETDLLTLGGRGG